MTPSPEFLKVKKDPRVRTIALVSRKESTKDQMVDVCCLRLFLDVEIPYTERTECVSVDEPVEIRFIDYRKVPGENKGKGLIVFFYMYNHYESPIKTFLRKINGVTNFHFRVVVGNSWESLEKANWHCHELYGVIGDDHYLLAKEVGPQNSASPVQW